MDAGDASPPEASVTSEAPDDQLITRRLTRIFANEEGLASVTVEVSDGIVRLQGSAADAEAKQRATKFAQGIAGVVYVDDDIQVAVAVDVTERIEPTLSRFAKRLNAITARLPLYGVALAIVVVFGGLSALIKRWAWPFRVLIRRRIFRDVIQQVVATVVFVLGVLVALEFLEATALVGAVLGAAGLAGIALGFAFRDIAENYLASLLLGLRRPFSANDHVRIDDHEGLVMRLTMRETVLMTLDGNHLRLPNALVYKSVMLNFTLNPLRRFQFKVGVGGDASLAEAQALASRTLLETPGVLQDPKPFCRVEELADFSVTVCCFGWVDQRATDFGKVRSEAVRRVKRAYDSAGIDMPFPTQRVQFEPAPPRERPEAAPPTGGDVETDAEECDVTPDAVIEDQISLDRVEHDEKDLLANGEKD